MRQHLQPFHPQKLPSSCSSQVLRKAISKCPIVWSEAKPEPTCRELTNEPRTITAYYHHSLKDKCHRPERVSAGCGILTISSPEACPKYTPFCTRKLIIKVSSFLKVSWLIWALWYSCFTQPDYHRRPSHATSTLVGRYSLIPAKRGNRGNPNFPGTAIGA